MSFFGGDNTMSHFSASEKYIAYKGEPRTEQRERIKAEQAKLKAVGFPKEKYFKFKNKDEIAKAKAKADCEAYAAEWSAKSGVTLEVCEGCFL